MSSSIRRILFSGYAPVHYLCFRPLYERLMASPEFEIFVSGGFRTKTEDGDQFDHMGLFRQFGVPEDRILPVEEMRASSFDVMFGANTKLLLPEKVGSKIQIFHGVSFRNRAVRKENLGADYFFMAGPYMKRRFEAAGLLPAADQRSLEIGFMKTDPLLDGSLDREELLRGYGFDGSRPVLLYAPTGQKHCSIETMGEEVIRALQATDDYDILIKLHDHPHGQSFDWDAMVDALEDEHTRKVRSYDVIPQLFLADLLLTDASSVSSEYSLLDRPMVFLDVPKLLAKAAAKEGSMMDAETYGQKAGDLVRQPEEVVETVAKALDEPERHAELRQAMARDLFYNPGHATDAAMEWLRSHVLVVDPA